MRLVLFAFVMRGLIKSSHYRPFARTIMSLNIDETRGTGQHLDSRLPTGVFAVIISALVWGV